MSFLNNEYGHNFNQICNLLLKAGFIEDVWLKMAVHFFYDSRWHQVAAMSQDFYLF